MIGVIPRNVLVFGYCVQQFWLLQSNIIWLVTLCLRWILYFLPCSPFKQALCRRGRVQLQEQTLSVFVVKAIEFPSLCVPRPRVQLVTQY